jgi:hypothetical protein
MRIFRRLHALATDAIEAIVYLFHSDTAADDLWEQAADRLAEAEAEEEVWLSAPFSGRMWVYPQMWDASKWSLYKLHKTGEWQLDSCALDRTYIFPTFEEAREFFAAGGKP